ncbi:MAG: DUF6489 family protein [Geminicoccaceae bacterium]
MKVNIEIDCTPEEARTFFGLPDVQPMQARLIEDLEQRIKHSMEVTDPKTLMDTWLPLNMKSLEQMQGLWAQFLQNAADNMSSSSKKR